MSNSFKPRAIVFDLDGTLLDTFPAIVKAWNAAMEPIFNRTFDPQEVVARFGPSDEGMMEAEFPPSLSQADKDAATARYFDAYREAHVNIQPFPGIETLLNFLRERNLPLGVMTGKGRRSCDITLAYFGWTERFDFVVTGTETTRHKPDPEGVLMVTSALGVDPKECVYIGDSPADIGAAENAGMFSVVAGWHDYYLEELKALNPDLWPQSPYELQRWFEANLA